MDEQPKAFLGIGVTGLIGAGAVIAAAVISGLPQALIRFAVELIHAAIR